MASVLRHLRRRRRIVVAVLVFLSVWFALTTLRSTPETRGVLVAARDLPAGTVLSEGDLTTSALPRETLTDVAISEAPEALGRVLLAPMHTREPLTTTRLLDPRRIPPGFVLLPVRLAADGVHVLRPGDRVDLIAVLRGQGRVLASDVRVVLLLPSSPDPGVLIELPQNSAPSVAAASASGELSATLRANEGGWQ